MLNYASCTGCTLTATYSMTGAADDPGFVHVPVRAERTVSGSTTSVLQITAASTYFAVGDVVEVRDDGVPRTVTAVAGAAVTIAPALAAAPPWGTHVDNWGAGASDVTLDPRLGDASACIDAGDNSGVLADLRDLDADGNTSEPLPYDLAGAARFVDKPDVADTGNGTAPLVDMGALEWQP